MRRPLAIAVAVGLIAALPAAAAAGANPAPPQRAQISYLIGAQRPNGGFGMSPRAAAATMPTTWAAMALGAAQHAGLLNAAQRRRAQRTAAYLIRTVAQERDDGSLERAVLALRALGRPVAQVKGVPLLSRLKHLIGPRGSVKDQTNLTSWAILALRSAGAAVPRRAYTWLATQRDGDGGFNYTTGGAHAQSDCDDTGAALEALALAPSAVRHRDASVVAGAVKFLRTSQDRDGGFPSEPGEGSNTQSTAWAVQGLDASHVKLASFHRPGGKTALQYLRAMTRAGGAVAYQRGTIMTPVWVTAQTLPAVLSLPYPIAAKWPASTAVPAKQTATTRTQTVPTPTVPVAPAPTPSQVTTGPAQARVEPGRTTGVQSAPRTFDVAAAVGRLLGSLHSLL